MNSEKLLNTIREHQSDVSVLLFFAAGLVGVWSQAIHPADWGAEMTALAKNIADHGTFANPFGALPTGPTAANPPLYPFVLAGLIKVLQVDILVYNAAVVGSILANAITAALLPRISVVFYVDAIPGVIASILWLTAMPAMPGWDTSYTVVGLLFFCSVASYSMSVDRNAGKLAGVGGATAGLLFLLNPSSLLISLPWIGFLFWRAKADLHRSVQCCGIMLAVLCLFYAGWCGRNYHQLGAFVVRTNLGMTLYASNNDCAESSLFRDQLNGCFQAHHPNASVREAQLVSKLGEVQYDQNRIADAKNWVQANPAKFSKLTMARMLQFWFPATEEVPTGSGHFAHNYVFPDWMRNWVRQQNAIAYAIWIITGLSLPGLILMARRHEPVTLFVLMVLAIYPLMYYVVVSDMRYRYPVLWLSLLAAGYLIREVVDGISARSVRQ